MQNILRTTNVCE